MRAEVVVLVNSSKRNFGERERERESRGFTGIHSSSSDPVNINEFALLFLRGSFFSSSRELARASLHRKMSFDSILLPNPRLLSLYSSRELKSRKFR